MESIRVTLCPACGECPEVAITAQNVTIGEAGNIVRLTPAQWNELVTRIRSGELSSI